MIIIEWLGSRRKQREKGDNTGLLFTLSLPLFYSKCPSPTHGHPQGGREGESGDTHWGHKHELLIHKHSLSLTHGLTFVSTQESSQVSAEIWCHLSPAGGTFIPQPALMTLGFLWAELFSKWWEFLFCLFILFLFSYLLFICSFHAIYFHWVLLTILF